MIHYTCDRCHRVINDEEELRFEVNIVTEIKLDQRQGGPAEDGGASAAVINDLLGNAMDAANSELFQTQRFDLCSDCYQEYARNPLGCEPVHVEFSEN